jgi:tRNA A-37 threonylcarbamoyl transferase component Bud32
MGIRVPQVIAYRQQGTQAELAIAEVSGAVPLNEAVARCGADRNKILQRLASALGRVHRAGWTHGALGSEHILVHAEEDYAITFIDLEKAKRSRMLRSHDLDRFWRRNGFLTAADRNLFEAEYDAARR